MGSLHLTLVLCALLTMDLAIGYLCLHGRTTLFAPLNDIGLSAWVETYGRHNLAASAWFFALLGLLTVLCVNTFVCTTDRVAALLRARARFPRRRFWFKLAPHIMHYALIVILLGYLASYLFSQVLPTRTLVPGASLALPGTTGRVTLESFDPVFYTGDRLEFLQDRVIQPRATLRLSDGESDRTALLTGAGPVRFKGYGLFLKDFSPDRKGGMMTRVRVDLHVRRDPGVPLYLAGIALFSVGLVLYLMDWILPK